MIGFHEKMYIIGKKRFTGLVVSVLINTAVIAGIISYLEPEANRAEAMVTEVSDDNLRLRSEIDGMPALLEQYKKNESEYERFLQTGFIGEQSRIVSRKLIDYFREKAGVSGIEYEFSPVKRFDGDYRTASFPEELLQTDMKIDIKAVLDLEVFAFLQYFEETLPGMLVLTKLSVMRNDNPLNQTTLESYGKGNKMDFIKAEADYEWMTLSPRLPPVQPTP